MHVYSFNGFGDDVSEQDLKKLIEVGDRIQQIAEGRIPASEEERAAAQKLVEKFGGD